MWKKLTILWIFSFCETVNMKFFGEAANRNKTASLLNRQTQHLLMRLSNYFMLSSIESLKNFIQLHVTLYSREEEVKFKLLEAKNQLLLTSLS